MAAACISMQEPTPDEGKKRRGFYPQKPDDFLKSSHFTIGQDERLNENCLQTAYKHDFPALPLNVRDPPIRHEATEKLLPGDDRYMYEQGLTETQCEFTAKPLVDRVDIEVMKQRLGATHYKQHTDDRPAAWVTSHKIDFVPLNAPKPEMKKAIEGTHLIFGDRDKAELPVTSYNSHYLDYSGEHARSSLVKATRGEGPTIAGDVRTTTWTTTTGDEFVQRDSKGQVQKIVHPCVDLFGTRGLPFKGVSEFTDKYTEKNFDADRPAPGNRSFQTTFKQSDGRGYDDWTTTHKESFVPQCPSAIKKVVKDTNVSNVPLDGMTNGRDLVTNYQRNFLKWPIEPKGQDSKDVDLKYKSQVVFGDPELANKFFETTHGATYVPLTASRPEKVAKELQKSHLPIDNWSADVNVPTYKEDFIDHGRSGPKEDRSAILERMHKSNVQFPVDNDLNWRTTHKSHFTPKRAISEQTSLDARRFHASHIFFGDTRITPFKDCY